MPLFQQPTWSCSEPRRRTVTVSIIMQNNSRKLSTKQAGSFRPMLLKFPLCGNRCEIPNSGSPREVWRTREVNIWPLWDSELSWDRYLSYRRKFYWVKRHYLFKSSVDRIFIGTFSCFTLLTSLFVGPRKT